MIAQMMGELSSLWDLFPPLTSGCVRRRSLLIAYLIFLMQPIKRERGRSLRRSSPRPCRRRSRWPATSTTWRDLLPTCSRGWRSTRTLCRVTKRFVCGSMSSVIHTGIHPWRQTWGKKNTNYLSNVFFLWPQNEETLKACAQDYLARIKKEEQRYQTLKVHAEEKIKQWESKHSSFEALMSKDGVASCWYRWFLIRANGEIAEVRAKNKAEMSALQVQLRREQLRVQSLEKSLDQKVGQSCTQKHPRWCF